VKLLEQQLEQAKKEAEEARRLEARRAELNARTRQLLEDSDRSRKNSHGIYSTAKWEYKFVPKKEMMPADFIDLLKEMESAGWDHNGSLATPHLVAVDGGKKQEMWVFRRPISKSSGSGSATTPAPKGKQTSEADPTNPFGQRQSAPQARPGAGGLPGSNNDPRSNGGLPPGPGAPPDGQSYPTSRNEALPPPAFERR
jgi:hypothetical protein